MLKKAAAFTYEILGSYPENTVSREAYLDANVQFSMINFQLGSSLIEH